MKKNPTDPRNGRNESTKVVRLRPKKNAPTSIDELRSLVEMVRACASSAEIATRADDDIVVKYETERMRAMLTAWYKLNGDSDLHARMRFLEGVQFFAYVTRTNDVDDAGKLRIPWEAVLTRARQLVASVEMLYPVHAKRVDEALTAQAIARLARTNRWDWKIIAKAWGRLDLNTESAWRAPWNKWPPPK